MEKRKVKELYKEDFVHPDPGQPVEILPAVEYDRIIIQYMVCPYPEQGAVYVTTQAKCQVSWPTPTEIENLDNWAAGSLCVAGGTLDTKYAKSIKHCSFSIPVPASLVTIFSHICEGPEENRVIRRFEVSVRFEELPASVPM